MTSDFDCAITCFVTRKSMLLLFHLLLLRRCLLKRLLVQIDPLLTEIGERYGDVLTGLRLENCLRLNYQLLAGHLRSQH